jgi:riboflavin synthase
MFTGLVEELGTVVALVPRGAAVELSLCGPIVSEDAALGASIAVNGCCLTVVRRENDVLTFEAGSETLSRTNLGRLQPGSRVNLERSLRVGDRLGGHYVSGHIDGLGELVRRVEEGPWAFLWFRVPGELARQMASKGSVAVDGVSLTLVEVTNDQFSVALIPHTLSVTTLGSLRPGDAVNIETDLLAKYVQRQLAFVTPS